MKPRLSTTVATYCLLGAAATTAFLMPQNILEQAAAKPYAPTNVVRLPGVVRDFQKTHPAISTAPSLGNGHYAGNLSQSIGNDDLPVYTGTGYRVASQWRDKNARPIAPHMYMFSWAAPGTIPVTTASATPPKATFDTYDSSVGAYGGANIGAQPTYNLGGAIPELVIPISVKREPNVGNLNFSGVSTISDDIHCNAMTVSGTLNISGNVSILAEGAFNLNTDAIVALNPGARLKIYMMAGGVSWNHVRLGDPARPDRVLIYNLGTAQFDVHNHAEIYANFISPNASMYVYNHAAFFGKFMGKGLLFNNHAGFHVDLAPSRDACNILLADAAGSKGANSTSGLTAAGFNLWYRDVLGENLSAVHPIELVENVSGVYEYHSDAFFPIDNALYGNDGQNHNYFFTYAFESRFTYDSCSNQYFEFSGADDAWLYIDGVLVMDRGGVIPGVSQTVDFDRLELADGKTYTMHFFYAQRNSAISSFHIRTNVTLNGEKVAYTMSGGVD